MLIRWCCRRQCAARFAGEGGAPAALNTGVFMPSTCTHCGRDESSSDLPGHSSTTDGGATWSCESCTAARATRCDACGEPIWPEQVGRSVTIRRERVDVPLWEVHAGCAPTHVLRCAWEAWDELGGPEEGGWTFEAGALMAAVPVAIDELDPRAMVLRDVALAPVDALLEKAFVFDGRRRRLSLTFELALPALDYPEATPHYE